MNDELHDRLRAAGSGFEPDRDRMWARVEDGMREPRGAAGPVRSGWRRPQLAVATGAAVALVSAVVVFGQAIGLGPVADRTQDPVGAGPGSPTEGVGDPASTGDSEPYSDGPSDGGGSPDGTETSTGAEQAPDWLHASAEVDGTSSDYWTQSDFVFEADEPLTAFTVELRIAEGEGLSLMSAWTTDDNLFAEEPPVTEDGFIVLRWHLKDGVTVPAGNEYTLAGQFDHTVDGPRSAADDTYAVTATTESGDTAEVAGSFE